MVFTPINGQQSVSSESIQRDPLGLAPISEDKRHRFLRCQLAGSHGALLPLEEILEIIQLETVDILPVPDVSTHVLGVGNWHGEILWLIDVNTLIGESPLWSQAPLLQQPMAVIIKAGHRPIGLIVEQVNDIELIDLQLIHRQADVCSPQLAPFVMGYPPDHRGIILDISAIVEHSLQDASTRSSILPSN